MPNVLVVDDDAHIVDVITFALEKAEFGFSVARNGQEALNLFDPGKHDILVLDVGMPELDGLQVCRELRKTSEVPILFLSARDEEIDRILGLEIGGDDYLTKPFSAVELQTRVANLIALRRRLQQRFAQKIELKPNQLTVTNPDDAFLKRALDILEEHFGNEEFGVERLQREIGMSRTQLHRKLKALTNQSTSEFIRTFRLQRAADLLRQNAGNVTEIAYKVGFSSQPYFTKCFQTHFGISPKAYQKQHTR